MFTIGGRSFWVESFVLNRLHIVVPDLFSSLAADKRLTTDLALPTLLKCLARASRQRLPAQNLADYLCLALGAKPGELAPITAAADGLAVDDGYWLRADPVHLNVQPNRIIVQTNVQPTAAEAAQLCQSLNAHFGQDGWQFFAPVPHRWYLRIPDQPALQTHPVFEVDGGDARQFQPHGAAALRWNAQLTEVQMLLNDHSVNRQIEARGGLPINSVWWWGGGRVAMPGGSDYAQVAGGDDMVAALVQWSGVARTIFTDAWSDDATLWVWDGLAAAVHRGDVAAWRQSLIEFERQCMVPAWAALARGEVQQLRLDVLQHDAVNRFYLSRGSAYKVWRRAQSLAKWAALIGD